MSDHDRPLRCLHCYGEHAEDDCAYRRSFRTWLGAQVASGGTTIEVGERVERGAGDEAINGALRRQR